MGYIKYKAVAEEISTCDFDVVTQKERAVIYMCGIDDMGNEIACRPSGLNLIGGLYKNSNALNTNKSIADTYCHFMNFIIRTCTDGDDGEGDISDERFDNLQKMGLKGLELYHGARFLEFCLRSGVTLDGEEIKGVKGTTAKQYANRLTGFYKSLLDLKIVSGFSIKTEKGKFGKKGLKNPFAEVGRDYTVVFPKVSRANPDKQVNLTKSEQALFIQVASEVAPNIKFGIILQMFGGLRRGEVVNLTIDDVPEIPSDFKGVNTLYANIKNRSLELFPNAPSNIFSKCQPKKERNQIVFDFDNNLYRHYSEHMATRKELIKKAKVKKLVEPLFVSDDGSPMDGMEYERHWDRVKSRFMKLLEKNSYQKYDELSRKKWGNHIGRGIFTNACLEHNLAKDARELANLRGDKFEESSQVYLDIFTVVKKTDNVLNKMGEQVGVKGNI